MHYTRKNSVRYTPESSQAIGERAGHQRLAYNSAVEFILDHPNTGKTTLQAQLAKWRKEAPRENLPHTVCQRPGLFRGRIAVRQFDHASLNTLRECVKEVELRNKPAAKTAKPPKHPLRPGRDPDPKRLFKSRKDPTVLIYNDSSSIQTVNRSTIRVDGVTINLAKRLPINQEVKSVQITERPSSVRKGRNRPLGTRSYHINLTFSQPDPPQKELPGNSTGIDAGIVHAVTTSADQHFDYPDTVADLRDQLSDNITKQKRLKKNGRSWTKLQRENSRLRRKVRNIQDNWERHTAKAIVEECDTVFAENLIHRNLRRSAKGTPENPGKNVKAKTGLNRSWSQARPGAIRQKIERRCEKTGTNFFRVNPKYTSITCSRCGYRDRKNRKNQAFLCLNCGLELNADVNAAINVEYRGTSLLELLALITCLAAGPAPESGRREGVPPSDDSFWSILPVWMALKGLTRYPQGLGNQDSSNEADRHRERPGPMPSPEETPITLLPHHLINPSG